MDFILMPSDFQLNKLIFFKDMKYSENTKKMYWNQYLLYIADIEIKYNNDLYELTQEEIEEYKNSIKDKSKNTIDSTNSFVKKYIEWYARYYKVEEKNFDLTIKKDINDEWYIMKETLFYMCNKMLTKTSISNIIPIIFARYGIVGEQCFYMRNVQWEDINHRNKCVAICGKHREILSYIPIDDNFLKWISILKNYEEQSFKEKEIKNKFIIKSQIENNVIENYASLNTKLYNAFKSIGMKRISFTTLNNCALVDYIDKIYENNPIESNEEFKTRLSVYYPNENISGTKILNIKNLFIEATGKVEKVRLDTTPSRFKKKKTLLKKKSIEKSEICAVENCNDKIYAEGLCKSHYREEKRLEKEYEESINSIKLCKIEGCNNKHYAKGYCKNHYNRHLQYGDSLDKKPSTCTVEGCNRKYFTQGYCQKHYWEFVLKPAKKEK